MTQTPGLCPYLTGGTAGPTRGAAYAVYCLRPDGAVRITSEDERERFCVTGHHYDCPGYRRAHVDEIFTRSHE